MYLVDFVFNHVLIRLIYKLQVTDCIIERGARLCTSPLRPHARPPSPPTLTPTSRPTHFPSWRPAAGCDHSPLSGESSTTSWPRLCALVLQFSLRAAAGEHHSLRRLLCPAFSSRRTAHASRHHRNGRRAGWSSRLSFRSIFWVSQCPCTSLLSARCVHARLW